MIRFSLKVRNFYKCVFAIVELLRKDKHEGLNAQLLVKVADCFISNYAMKPDKSLNHESLKKHKPYLYKFFTEF